MRWCLVYQKQQACGLLVTSIQYDVLYKHYLIHIRRCGPQPNSKLLINYGFVDEDNPYDRVTVEVIFHFPIIPANILSFK